MKFETSIYSLLYDRTLWGTDKSLQPASNSVTCCLCETDQEISLMNEDSSVVFAACKQKKDFQTALSYPSPQNTGYSHTKWK